MNTVVLDNRSVKTDKNLDIRKLAISELELFNYRNFDFFKLQLNGNPVIITGQNGTGKTNILESISLLSPGRGLRNAKFEDIIARNDSPSPFWKIEALVSSDLGQVSIESQYNKQITTTKRTIILNGAKIKSSELTKICSIIWLTPQMEFVLSSAVERRKFLDRAVYLIEPLHAVRIQQYEYLIKERMKILLNEPHQTTWLYSIEKQIAQISTEIAKARVEALKVLKLGINEIITTQFPKAIIEISGEVEKILEELTESHINAKIIEELSQLRYIDAQTKRTNFGTHKSDFIIRHPENGQNIKFCSTGQQKALLLSIILGQIYTKIKITNEIPIVLLDEISAHLDDTVKSHLFELLLQLNCQFWITTTETSHVKYLERFCQIFSLDR